MFAGARCFALAALAGALALGPGRADGYSFSVRARTVAQVYQLRGFRLVGADVVYGRQRYTQSLALTIHDIGGLEAGRRRSRVPGRGPRVSWTSYLRLDHDFGAWTAGAIGRGTAAIDAVDLIPELDESVLALDVLYGYVTVDGLLGDRLTVRVGRQLSIDGMDVWALDGATVTVRPPLPVAIELSAGLRVRDTSPVAPAAVELDGTSGADCQEYVEGPVPGAGHWELIDRSTITQNRPLAADRSLCPQRAVRMPTIGAAIETRGTRRLAARLSYRRTQSSTVGVIGDVDRLTYPDLGLYPDEAGQAPADGVNAEHVAAVVRGRLRAGGVRISPWASTRASLVHHLIDRAAVGAEVRVGDHVLTPEVAYRVPTWDADSIFGIFAVHPTTDARLGWSAHGAYVHAWVRRYHDADRAPLAYGVEASAERAVARTWRARAGALADGGFGGERVGASVAARYTARDGLTLATSVAGWRLAPATAATWWEAIAQGRASWAWDSLYAFHAVVEASASRYTPGLVRILLVLDLAFEPEM